MKTRRWFWAPMLALGLVLLVLLALSVQSVKEFSRRGEPAAEQGS